MLEPAWEAHPPSNYPMLGPTPGPGSGPRHLFAALWDLLQLWGHQSGPRTRPWCLRCRHLHEERTTYSSSILERAAACTVLALLLNRSGRDTQQQQQHFSRVRQRSPTGTAGGAGLNFRMNHPDAARCSGSYGPDT